MEGRRVEVSTGVGEDRGRALTFWNPEYVPLVDARFLSDDELAEALAAENAADLFIGGATMKEQARWCSTEAISLRW